MSKSNENPITNVLSSFKPNLCTTNRFFYPFKVEIKNSFIFDILNRPCSICLNSIKNPILIIPCNHIFCKYCLKLWIKKNAICPLCRALINTKVNI